jgi:replicative DNA helicase
MNDILLKVPPHSLEAEESVLSRCIIDNPAIDQALDLIEPEDFYKTAHRKIFSAISDIYHKENMVDLVLLANYLKESDDYSDVGGAVYLAEIVDKIPLATNIESYCKVIKEKSVAREIIKASHKNIQACYSGGDDILDQAQTSIMSINSGVKCEAQSIGDIIQDQVDHLEKLGQRDDYITGVKSGFEDLDLITCGFQKTDLILLAARPGMGKTALGLNIAINMEAPVVIFSLEMSKSQLVNRALSSEAEINGQKFRSGRFSEADWHNITNTAGRLSALPITIIDTPMMKYQDIIREARRLKRKSDIQMVIVDYLQFVVGDKNLKENYRYGEISRQLKGAAKTLNVPFLVLAQLNRKLEDRKDKRPMLSDLRDSGNLEQDSDVVMFIYRPEMYGEKDNFGNEQPGVAEIIVAKQRTGPTGTVKVQWSDKYTKFRDLLQYKL